MRYLKESLIYRLFSRLSFFYQSSFIKRLLDWLAEACKHSVPARWFRNSMAREGAFQYSLIFRLLKALLTVLDRWILRISEKVEEWSQASLIVNAARAVIHASKQRLFALVFPIFGVGYLAGRIIQNKLMVRDVLLLGVMFIFAGVLLIDREKRRAIWRNSFAYQAYILLLE